MKSDIRNIPLANPKAAYLARKNEILKAVSRVLDEGRYILGADVKKLEEEFSEWVGLPYGVGVGSGTDALEIAMRALEIGPGNIVFTVSHTAVATISAILRCGAIPILVDIDPETMTMNPDCLESAIKHMEKKQLNSSRSARAIIPVHLYGYPAKLGKILKIARRYGLYVIEDCAQAHGAMIDGRQVGSFGDIGAFSFYPTKNLGACGDGGMVVTGSNHLYKRMLALREYGWQERFVSEFVGINSRLDTLQAAILLVKLRYLAEDTSRRREIAGWYNDRLADLPINRPVVYDEKYNHAYHLYVIRLQSRNRLMRYLQENRISSAIHYPLPVHLQPAFKNQFLISSADLKVTEKICREILSLPIYPELAKDQIEYVCKAIQTFYKKRQLNEEL